MRRAMYEAAHSPSDRMRLVGIVSAVVGVAIVWGIRQFGAEIQPRFRRNRRLNDDTDYPDLKVLQERIIDGPYDECASLLPTRSPAIPAPAGSVLPGRRTLLATSSPMAAQRPSAPESFADLADEVTGAVVNISASTTVEARNRTLPQLAARHARSTTCSRSSSTGAARDKAAVAAATARRSVSGARIPSAPASSSILRASWSPTTT